MDWHERAACDRDFQIEEIRCPELVKDPDDRDDDDHDKQDPPELSKVGD